MDVKIGLKLKLFSENIWQFGENPVLLHPLLRADAPWALKKEIFEILKYTETRVVQETSCGHVLQGG